MGYTPNNNYIIENDVEESSVGREDEEYLELT